MITIHNVYNLCKCIKVNCPWPFCLVYLVYCGCVAYWVLIVGYTEQYNAKVLAARAAKRIEALHVAVDGDGGGGRPSGAGVSTSYSTGSKPRTQPADWFRPLWNMIGAGEKWPITINHLDYIRRKVVSQKVSVLQWLNMSEQDGLWKRMRNKYQPRQALQGFITARLSDQVRPAITCPSYDKGKELLAANGGGLENHVGRSTLVFVGLWMPPSSVLVVHTVVRW